MLYQRPTLSKYLIEQLRGTAGGQELAALLVDVAAAVKTIAAAVAKGALLQRHEGAWSDEATVNVHGEVQQPLDLFTNEIVLRHCEWGGLLAGMVSEEL